MAVVGSKTSPAVFFYLKNAILAARREQTKVWAEILSDGCLYEVYPGGRIIKHVPREAH